MDNHKYTPAEAHPVSRMNIALDLLIDYLLSQEHQSGISRPKALGEQKATDPGLSR